MIGRQHNSRVDYQNPLSRILAQCTILGIACRCQGAGQHEHVYYSPDSTAPPHEVPPAHLKATVPALNLIILSQLRGRMFEYVRN